MGRWGWIFSKLFFGWSDKGNGEYPMPLCGEMAKDFVGAASGPDFGNWGLKFVHVFSMAYFIELGDFLVFGRPSFF